MGSTVAIEVEGLSKRFGATLAVDDLSFTVGHGRIVGFLGPNGAGKTTTLRALLGLVRPTAGSTAIEGRPYERLERPLEAVGAVLDGGMFHPGRSGRNHLRSLALAGGIATSRVDELLELVELSDAADRRAGGYSLGMRQRLGLAAALIGDPRVLVLDEPANGLDPQGIRWLRDFLRRLAGEGRAILVSSHVLAEVAQTVDEVVVIHRGRSIEQAPIGELLARRAGGVRVAGPDAGRLADILRADGAAVTVGDDGALAVADRSGEQVGALIAANAIHVAELSAASQSLEEVFFELTADGDDGKASA
ncbi:MAG: ATP-binding cassette domain-containing protein [Solirubrobacterales bacterium]|nr:ATP-binding cassette domain-containing protein [Solirubrobacterales bacterium]